MQNCPTDSPVSNGFIYNDPLSFFYLPDEFESQDRSFHNRVSFDDFFEADFGAESPVGECVTN
jgi:hypothetical protein